MFGMIAAQGNQLFANLAICAGSLSSFALPRVLDNLFHFAASASATICITASARMNQRIDASFHGIIPGCRRCIIGFLLIQRQLFHVMRMRVLRFACFAQIIVL